MIDLSLNQKDIQSSFLKIADEILNSHLLVCKDTKFRVLAIEFYYLSKNHLDLNTHAAKFNRAKESQSKMHQWYLHKLSINPKNNFKGIDYTFGQDGAFGGILIKKVLKESNKKLFSQSKFIDELILILRPKSVDEFVWQIEKESLLYFEKSELKSFKIVAKKRKGLKNSSFKDALYRFEIDEHLV